MNKLKGSSGLLLVLVAMIVLSAILIKGFGTGDNAVSLGLLVSTVGLVSCTMLFCLAGGDFDLSVGSTLALGGVLAAMVTTSTKSVPLGIAAALAAGAVVGLINGLVIAKVGINALITTLATMQIVRGLTNIVSHGSPQSCSVVGFDALGKSMIAGIPMPIVLTILAFVVFGWLLNRTVFGRDTLAIGGNVEAARLAGIKVEKTKIWVFVLSGMVAAFAGVAQASRLLVGSNNAGDKLELQAIAACVLGGVSLAGGVGTMSGVVVGVLIMGIVQNAMSLLNIDTFYQMVVTGAILLAAVVFDKIKTAQTEKRNAGVKA